MNDNSIEMTKRIVNAYNNYGIDTAISIGIEILEKSAKAGSLRGKLNGEICEVILMLITKDYIKKHNLNAQCYQSMVLKDPRSGDENRVVENDMILIHNGFVATAECKSYMGDLQIVNPCTIKRSNGKNADVYKQSQIHLRSLKTHCEIFAKSGVGAKPPIVSFCFIFSKGTIKDCRSDSEKQLLPVVTVKTINKFYDNLFGVFKNKDSYNYSKMKTFFDKMNCSKKTHIMHKKYVGY